MSSDSKKKKAAFICVHNSLRSQIAEAVCKHFASDLIECYSAGTQPKPEINPTAVRLMKQVYGIDMESTQHTKLIEDIPKVDIVITMGCNVKCPAIPGVVTEDWGLDDPTGKSDEEYMKVISNINDKVLKLRERVNANLI